MKPPGELSLSHLFNPKTIGKKDNKMFCARKLGMSPIYTNLKLEPKIKHLNTVRIRLTKSQKKWEFFINIHK